MVSSAASSVWRTTITDGHVRSARATLSDAQDAFLRGEFERCLTLCETIEARNERRRFEVSILRARVLLRLQRATEAAAEISACAFVPTSVDEIVTAQLLLGAAQARIGKQESAAQLLREATRRAPQAHRTIQAELTLYRGIVEYNLERYDAADALLAAVPEDADLIHARALEYRGWVAYTRGRLEDALVRFSEATSQLGRCRWRDRFVEASVLQGISSVKSQIADTRDWPAIEQRIARFDWEAPGLARPRFWTALYCGTMRELLGDPAAAQQWIRQAERCAPGALHRAIAFCTMAEFFRNAGEHRAHFEFAERAKEQFDSNDARPQGYELLQVPLIIAEELASIAPDEAARFLELFRSSTPATVSTLSGRMFSAVEHIVRARIAEARGERNIAVREYTRALETLRATQHHRRGGFVAVQLARLTGANRYVTYAGEALQNASPEYWLAKELRALRSDATPPLTDNQRRVLTLVAQGKTYKEIAAELNRSWKTVNNSVEQMRAKFGVHSRGELVAEALRVRAIDVHPEVRISRSA